MSIMEKCKIVRLSETYNHFYILQCRNHRLALTRDFALAYVKHASYSISRSRMATALPMYDMITFIFLVIIYLLYNKYLFVEIIHTRVFEFLKSSGHDHKCEPAMGGLRSRVHRTVAATCCRSGFSGPLDLDTRSTS